MATVEIEESQLDLLRRSYNLFNAMWTHPEVGMKAKKLLKEMDPKVAIPEIDAAAPHVAKIEALEKKISDLETGLTTGYQQHMLEKDWSAARTEFELTDDGLAAARKIAEEQKLTPRAAAAITVHDTPKPAQPSGFTPSGWNLFGPGPSEGEQADMKALLDDPDGWFDRTAAKVLSEERRGNGFGRAA